MRKIENDFRKRKATQTFVGDELSSVDAVQHAHATLLEQPQNAGRLWIFGETLVARIERRRDNVLRLRLCSVRELRQRTCEREIALADEQHDVFARERRRTI